LPKISLDQKFTCLWYGEITCYHSVNKKIKFLGLLHVKVSRIATCEQCWDWCFHPPMLWQTVCVDMLQYRGNRPIHPPMANEVPNPTRPDPRFITTKSPTRHEESHPVLYRRATRSYLSFGLHSTEWYKKSPPIRKNTIYE